MSRVAQLTEEEVADVLYFLDDADMITRSGGERADRLLKLWDRLHKWRLRVDEYGRPRVALDLSVREAIALEQILALLDLRVGQKLEYGSEERAAAKLVNGRLRDQLDALKAAQGFTV